MSEKKQPKRTENEYIGMSSTELQHQVEICQMMISNAKRHIKELKKEIEQEEGVIKQYTNALHRIETARGKTSKIEYIAILKVYVKTETERKNPNVNTSYYSPSDYKDFLVYNFDVLKVNKDDYNKACTVLYSSETDSNAPVLWNTIRYNSNHGFRANQKKELQTFIINAIKAFNVEEVYFNRDVSIGKAEIEKVLGKSVKVKGKYEDFCK